MATILPVLCLDYTIMLLKENISKSGLSIMIAIEIKTISFHFPFSLMQIIAIFKHLWGKILQEMSYG